MRIQQLAARRRPARSTSSSWARRASARSCSRRPCTASRRAGRALRVPELRGLVRDAARERAVRPRAGAFTGAVQAKPGLMETAHRGRCSWTRWRAARADAGQGCCASSRRARSRASQRQAAQDRRALPRGDQPQLEVESSANVPGATFTPAQRITLTIPPLRARVVRSAARRDVRAANLPRAGRPEPDPLKIMALLEPTRGRATSRAQERHGARRAAVAGPVLDTEHPAHGQARCSVLEPGPRDGRDEPPVAAGGPPTSASAIVDALSAARATRSRAAKSLGIPRRTFVARLDQYKIPRPKKPV